MARHPRYSRPSRRVPWDRIMLAQLPSGTRYWFVTLDNAPDVKTGRILNTKTRKHYRWFIPEHGKTIVVSGVEPVLPPHIFKTIRSLLVRPTQDDLLKAARAEIQCASRLVRDLAAEEGKSVEEAAQYLSIFTRRVEDKLIGECLKFCHLAPNFEESNQ